jgi:hypothetical protein
MCCKPQSKAKPRDGPFHWLEYLQSLYYKTYIRSTLQKQVIDGEERRSKIFDGRGIVRNSVS